MGKEYFYDAFISYRHLPDDVRIAEKLQRLLERLKKYDPATGRKRPLRVFRDQSELPVSEDLSKDIDDALQNSDYLIIICSPKLKESRWCMKELKTFRELHGNTNAHIIPLLIEGEPEDSFPDAIRYRQIPGSAEDGRQEQEEIEPLAADVRSGSIDGKLKKLKKTEYLRIAAPIMGLRFDDLYQRRKRERNKKLLIGCSAAAVVLTALLLYIVYSQGKLSATRLQARRTEAERIAEISEAKQNDPALAYLLAEHAYNMFTDENDVPEKVKQVYTGKALSYLLGLQNDLLQLQFSDSFPSAVEDNMRIYGGGRYLALTDGTMTYLYDIAAGEQKFSCEGNTVYFDPDASFAASCYAKDGNNVCVFYSTETGDTLCTVQNARRTMAAATMDAYWEDGVGYAVDSDNGSKVFRIRISEDGKAEASEDIPQTLKDHILSVCSCYDYPSYYLKTFREGSIGAAMITLGDYASSLTYAQKTACAAAAGSGCTVTHIQPGDQIGLLKCTLDGAVRTALFSEDSGDILDWVDGCIYYDAQSKYCFGINGTTAAAYSINEAFSAAYGDRFYSRVSPDGERFFALSGDSMDRFYGKGGLIRMTICDMTRPESEAVLLDEQLYTSSVYQTYLCYCNTDVTRVIYIDADEYMVLYDVQESRELLRLRVAEPNSIQAVSMNEDCSLIAVAFSAEFKKFEVAVYSADSGQMLQSIDLTGMIGKPNSPCIMHIEFSGDMMLVSTASDSVLLKKENGLYSKDPAAYLSNCGSRSYPWPCLISGDGLIFFTSQTDSTYLTHPRYLSSIYDIADGKEIKGTSFSRAFIYSADKKTLIAEDFVSGGTGSTAEPAGTINVYRYQDGEMKKVGEIITRSADMHLSDSYMLDGDHILLENDEISEIYDITTGELVCSISATGLLLSGGRVINRALPAPCRENSYPYLSDSKQMQAIITEMMTQQLGKVRVLTEEEKDIYSIKE